MLNNLRKYSRETVIKGKAATLILPSETSRDFTKLQQLLESEAGSVVNQSNDDSEIFSRVNGPAILIGNLADNKCVEKLYYDFLCVTDRWYPGPAGYEVRTLIDPYGTGYNIIHIGYSDEEGLESALEYFTGQIGGTIPFQSEIRPTRLHIPDQYADHILNDELDSTKDTYFYSIRAENKGYLAYMTGNKTALKEYEEAFLEIMDMPRHHLMIYNRFVVWRLLEAAGMIEGDILEKAPGFFLEWVESEEGIGAIDLHRYQSPYLARNNHGTIPALGIKMISMYLKTYYPDMTKADEYEKLADNVYKPYFEGSWKPQCDGLCHGWWLSQPVLFHYGLIDRRKKYFKSNGARKAAECAVAVINNMGYLAAAGDAIMSRQHPGFVLRIAAAYYNDGRYKYANDILPFEYANSGEMSAMFRQFDTGLEPVRPNDGGTTVVPVDGLVYDAWKHEDEEHASTVTDTPPSGPIEKCFDKISFRSGWGITDDFLLMDGLGGGGHSYADAGAVLEYSTHGVPFLVSEDSLTFVEPENHNLVTISKDGIRKPIPAFPAIEELREYEDGISYLRLLSKDNNGADWTREIYFIPGVGIAARDSIQAAEDGEFSIEVHFRTPGPVLPKEDGYVAVRNDTNGNKVAFVLKTLSPEVGITFERQNHSHLFRTSPGKEKSEFEGMDNKALFIDRYRVKDLGITAYKAKENKKMEKGDKVVFTHFISYGINDEKPVQAEMAEDGITIEVNGKVKALAFAVREEQNEIDFDSKQPEFDFFADLLHEETSRILDASEEEGLIARGLMSGEIIIGTSDGEKTRRIKEDEPVHSVCIKDGYVFAGMGKDTIAAYKNGINLWTNHFERTPTMYYWWELQNQRVVSIKASDGYIYAGCGDNHIRCFDYEGDEMWSYYYRASVPMGFEIFDIDSDGEDEIIIYGGLLSAYSQIEIIGTDGKLKYRPNAQIGAGWTSTTTSFEVFSFEGNNYIIQGVNRNKNLVLYKFDKDSNEFIEVFSEHLAGAVSAIYVDGGTIYTGTSLGFISAYDLQGARKWFRPLNGGIKHISKADEGLIVLEKEGMMYRLDMNGETVVMSMDSLKAARIIEMKDELILMQDRGMYGIKREREEYDL